MVFLFPPAPTTVVAGTTVFTKDLWNNGPAEIDAWFNDPPRCVLQQTVAQSIPNNADTPVAFDQVIYDNRHGMSADGTTWTVPANGIYLVTTTSNLAWTGAANCFVASHIVNPGRSTFAATEIPATPGPVRFQFNVAALISLGVSDRIQLRLYQNSGGTQPTGTVGIGCRLSARWICGQ